MTYSRPIKAARRRQVRLFRTTSPQTIKQGWRNLEWNEDMEDKIKLLDPQVQVFIKKYCDIFGRIPAPVSCKKLVTMDLKMKEEFYGQRIH